jgi:hypothetical protein
VENNAKDVRMLCSLPGQDLWKIRTLLMLTIVSHQEDERFLIRF